MLDVHPPHTATHTWRDFLLHIATICVGLLIAVGLEQSVEAVHRAHERRELIEDFRNECRKTIHLTGRNITSYAADRDLQLATIALLETTAPQGGVVSVEIPARPMPALTSAPSRAVWSVAKSNGKVALLPENVAEVFDRADYEGAMFFATTQTLLDKRSDTFAVADELQVSLQSRGLVRVKTENIHELAAAIGHQAETNDLLVLWSSAWNGACKAVVDGVQSRDAMDAYISRERATSMRKQPVSFH
jgi:hypothetical protein